MEADEVEEIGEHHRLRRGLHPRSERYARIVQPDVFNQTI